MDRQSRKWMTLVATLWIMAFTGTNFNFSSYSSTLKSFLGISQLQLNSLSVASDFGKAFGWCCGVCLLYFPLSSVMSTAALFGLVGYGLQWLAVQGVVTLPYVMVFILSLLAGCSICWFNTICYVLCIRNFPANRALALSLITSFNGISAAIYTLIANAIDPSSSTVYLFLDAFLPILMSVIALLLIQLPFQTRSCADASIHESLVFSLLYIVAAITGFYFILLNPLASGVAAPHLLFGAVLLLMLPVCLPGIVYSRDWAWKSAYMNISLSSFNLLGPNDCDPHKEITLNLIGANDFELHKEFIDGSENACANTKEGYFEKLVNLLRKDHMVVLGEEHSAKLLATKWDFWLYYLAYFCGGTIGLVYSNNLGQIVQSLGHQSELDSYIILYSSCSFFGRLLSAAPEFLHNKVQFARTGWFTVALLPTPIAFILLAASGSSIALSISTGLIGLSSGFILSAAVPITSELFGPNSAGINHNILITSIPVGSFLYGLLAAINYDSNGRSFNTNILIPREEFVCIGGKCYSQTFMWWACISLLGLATSFLLYLRTKSAYANHGKDRTLGQNSVELSHPAKSLLGHQNCKLSDVKDLRERSKESLIDIYK